MVYSIISWYYLPFVLFVLFENLLM